MYTTTGLRCCNVCGKPMSAGYLFPDIEEHICSDECLLVFYEGDVNAMESDRSKFDTQEEVFFYTEWDTIYVDL